MNEENLESIITKEEIDKRLEDSWFLPRKMIRLYNKVNCKIIKKSSSRLLKILDFELAAFVYGRLSAEEQYAISSVNKVPAYKLTLHSALVGGTLATAAYFFSGAVIKNLLEYLMENIGTGSDNILNHVPELPYWTGLGLSVWSAINDLIRISYSSYTKRPIESFDPFSQLLLFPSKIKKLYKYVKTKTNHFIA